jgi:hypothetical protein
MTQLAHTNIHRFCRLAAFAILLAWYGCASFPFTASQKTIKTSAGGLRISMRNESTATFSDNAWSLTTKGIHGTAAFQTQEGQVFTRDTTISYWDISSAAPARGNTVGQFLLTVLGIILVIGLAAIILYAAFLATDR